MYVPPLYQIPGSLPLMPPPPLYVPNFGHHFHIPRPVMPHFNIPKPGDIKNIKPGPGQVFSGVAVSSQSGYSTDKDGNVIKTGGSTVVVNDNGEVKETKGELFSKFKL